MTDDSTKDKSEELQKAAATIDGAPMGFVKGGTHTDKSARMFEERFQDAEKRRDVADAERKVASIPIDHGGAQLHVSQMTAHPEIPKAYIPLTYVNSHGEPVVINGEEVLCQADLIIGMDAANPMELTLILVCPRCQQQGHKHEQDCQIQIRQSNKWFEFKSSMGPATFVHQGKVYKSAGMVMQSEAFTCPDCGWRARIDKNRVWPD